MDNLQTFKTKGMESISNLIEQGKEQPEEVKTWGVTAAAGVAGALALTAGAKGLLAVIGVIANPPVAITLGALGGGALGWSYMQSQAKTNAAGTGSENDASAANNVTTQPIIAESDAANETAGPATDVDIEAVTE